MRTEASYPTERSMGCGAGPLTVLNVYATATGLAYAYLDRNQSR
jgi:hypothetical protein